MLVTDLWKNRMMETLQMVYGNKLKEEGLSKYLDNYVKESKSPTLLLRNIYEYNYNININANEILNVIKEKDLIIGANGAFSYNIETKLADTSELLMNLITARNQEKKIAKDFEKRNMLKAPFMISSDDFVEKAFAKMEQDADEIRL